MQKHSKISRYSLIIFLTILNAVVLGRFAWFGWGAYYFRKAEQSLGRRDFDSARSDLQNALCVWPRDIQVLLLDAQAARRMGKTDDAFGILQSPDLIAAAPESVSLELDLIQLQLGNADLAQQFLMACTENPQATQTPLILEALIVGGLHRVDLATTRQCLEMWKERCASESQRKQGMIWNGELAIRTGDVETAIARYREVIDLQPNNDVARLRLAEFLVRYIPQESIVLLSELHRRKPESRDITFQVARCYRALGEQERAIKLLDEILKHASNDYDALLERGQIAIETQSFAEAERLLRIAHGIHPERRDVNLYLARALQLAGKRAEYEHFRGIVANIDAALEDRMRQLRETGSLQTKLH